MWSVGGGYVDAGGATRLDANAGDKSLREHGEIWTPQGRHQQRPRAGVAPAAMNRALAKSIARGIEAGEIIASWIAANSRKRIEKRLIQPIGFRYESNVDGSVDAVHVDIAPVGIVFRQTKVGQDVIPVPAGVTGGRPVVVILRVAAVIGHAVDGARAADHLAARQRKAAGGQRRLRLRALAPR